MSHLFLKNRTRRVTNVLSGFVLIASLFLPTYTLASTIEPYDFEGNFQIINRVWEPEIALYVAKKFAAENGFDESSVSVSHLIAGASNNFIYLVHIKNQFKFVIKGLRTSSEAEALLLLQDSTQIKNLENNSMAAKICLSKTIKSYITNDKRVYYFAILEAAQGQQLLKIMANELLNTKDINKLSDIFYDIGRQISELHKTIIGPDQFISPEYLLTIIHDDLHPENSFFDFETKKFSLIDNDSIAKSMSNPMPVYREIYGLYEIPVIAWPSERITVDLLKDANPHDIAAIYIELIKGMASRYQNPRAAVSGFTNKIIELNNMALAFLKDSTSEPWMSHPKDKSEGNIARGKLSRAINAPRLNNLYQLNLTIINQDLKEILPD